MVKTPLGRRLASRLRVAEKTLLAFFTALLIASLTLSLPGTTLGALAVFNVMVGGLIVALSEEDLVERSRIASALRDWLPALLMLLAYRESGLFIKADPAHRLDHLFILWDETMLRSRWVVGLLDSCAPWLQHYLELCYLLCYPLVPLGFAALYLMRPATAAQRQPSRMPKNLSLREVDHSLAADDGPSSACGPPSAEATARRPKAPGRRAGDGPEPFALRPKAAFWRRVGGRRPEGFRPQGKESHKSVVSRARFLAVSRRIGMSRPINLEVMFDKFWTAVLLATLFCYAVYPVFPLTPPRLLFNDVPGPPVSPLLRHMNLWLLDRLSVQACVFPSAHAAAVTAVALAVRAYRPRLGILFCIAALSIVVATVYGRYHYAADAVAGVLVGVAAFAVSRRIQRS